MRILMTSDTFLPRIGGAEVHVYNIAKRLAEHGHDITLVECDPSPEEPASDLIPGVRIVHIPWRMRAVPTLAVALWREARGADVIHAHYSYRLAALAGVIGRLRRIPMAVILHGLGTLDIPGARLPHRVLHSVYRFVSLRCAALVISTSEDIAEIARRAVRVLPLIVIPNGYDENVFFPGEPPEELAARYRGKKVILTVRRLVPKNGIQYLVEALPRIIERIPEVRYAVAGDGRLKDVLMRRAQELGVKDHIDFLGMVENARIPGYLRRADVVVFPSTAESSSIACAEAMATGVPVVASRVGGLIELLGKNEERGTLVTLVDWETSDYGAPTELPRERYEALADAVITALTAPNTATTDSARHYAETQLSWKVIAAKTEEALSKLVHG